MKILALTKYDSMGASSRLRTIQYVELLNQRGLFLDVQPLISGDMLKRRYRVGSYGLLSLVRSYVYRLLVLFRISQYDLVIVEKESLPWFPVMVEQYLLSKRPYIVDYDDATFHNYDMHRSWIVRVIYGDRLDKLMSSASCVTCGNNYLKSRAVSAGAVKVVHVPTVVDVTKYTDVAYVKSNGDGDKLKVVWIGTPATQKYLEVVIDVLEEMSANYNFCLVAIGASNFSSDKLQVICKDWSESAENKLLADSDIGIMPLVNDSWERGKCGYKLIQYMASGLPVIGSDVGVNSVIVDHGNTGFLARSQDDWRYALKSLLSDRNLRMSLGRSGRARVEDGYSLHFWAQTLESIFTDVASS